MNISLNFRKDKQIIYLIVLVALSSFLFFYRLGHLSLWDPDEPRYAEAAKQMVKTGDWLVPRFNGQERFDKPVLFYWLIAFAYKIFGVSEFAARFWPALFGVGGIIMVYLLGKKMFSPLAGFLAGLVLATNIQYMAVSRLAITDMTLTFFLELAFFAFWFGYQTQNKLKRNLLYLIFYISVALAALTKGPVAVIFAGFIILLFLIVTKDLKVLKEMQIFWGVIIFVIVAFPWYILIIQKYGRSYIDYFFLKHNLARFATPELKHPGPVVYYLPVLLIGLFPWSAFLFSSFWYLWSGKSDILAGQKKQIIFLFIWFCTIFLFFSVARAKLPTYIMPLYFPAALLVGKFLELSMEIKDLKGLGRHLNLSLSLLAVLFLSTAIALSIFLKINCPLPIFTLLIINGWLLSGLVFILFLFRRRRFLPAFVCLAAVFSIFAVMIFELVAPKAVEVRSLKEAGQKVFSLSKGKDKILSYRFLKPGSVFYGNQNIQRLENKRELIYFLNSSERIFCWIDIDDEYYEEVKELIKTKVWVIAQTPTKLVISNQP